MILLTNLHIHHKFQGLLKYTHVTKLETRLHDQMGPILVVEGENLDSMGFPRNVTDYLPLREIHSSYFVVHHPKE